MPARKNIFQGILSALLCADLLLLIPWNVYGETAREEGEIAVVCNPDPKDRLHLRTKAFGSAKSLGKYYSGVTVLLLPDSKAGAAWAHVRIGNAEGYMEAQCLAFGEDAARVISTQPEVTVDNQAGSGLNLRAGQSIESPVICLLKNGAKVTVMGVSEEWLHVRAGEETGYIRITGTSPRVPYTYGVPGIANAQVTHRVERAALYAEFTDAFWDGGNPAAPVVKYLKTGTKVTVADAKGEYCQIHYQGHTYWISRYDLDFAEE